MPSMTASPSRCSRAGTKTTEPRKRRAISAGSTGLVRVDASTTRVRSASWNFTTAPTACASSTALRTSSMGGTFRRTVRPSDARSDAAIILSAAFLAPCTKTVDRKSTRLNSSHRTISYAVFCVKKKNVKTDIVNRLIFLRDNCERTISHRSRNLHDQVHGFQHESDTNDGIRTHLDFFFNDTPPTEIYTLSLHDALPICSAAWAAPARRLAPTAKRWGWRPPTPSAATSPDGWPRPRTGRDLAARRDPRGQKTSTISAPDLSVCGRLIRR